MPAGDSQYTLDLAVAEVVQAGVPVMVAAGNEDTDACLTSPARYLRAFCLMRLACCHLPVDFRLAYRQCKYNVHKDRLSMVDTVAKHVSTYSSVLPL